MRGGGGPFERYLDLHLLTPLHKTKLIFPICFPFILEKKNAEENKSEVASSRLCKNIPLRKPGALSNFQIYFIVL